MTAHNKILKGFTQIRTPRPRNLVNVHGFTLIELLIVIAVLGILAVAVLSAINPIEQIDRSKDTGSRSDAEQLISAIDRYYTGNGYYPWQLGATDTANEPTAWGAVNSTWSNGSTPVIAELSTSTGELKQSFIDRITSTGYNTLFKYNRGTAGDSTYVCFRPASNQFTDAAEQRCTAFGGNFGDFPSSACPGSPVFYSCLP